MSINWKAGIISFLFFASLGFVLFHPFDRYAELSIRNFVIFIAISSLYLTSIFLFALYKSRKGIADHTYSFSWLAKTGLGVFFFVILSVFIFSFLLSIIYPGGHPPLWAFLFLTPYLFFTVGGGIVTTFLIFIIPSVFLSKFRQSEKAFRFVSLFFVVVFFILAMFYTAYVSTCEFNRDYACVARKGVAARDEKVCEQVVENFKQGLCYLHMSKNWNNIEICENVSDEKIQYQCMVNVAINTDNKSICENLNIDEIGYNKESCISRIESKLNY